MALQLSLGNCNLGKGIGCGWQWLIRSAVAGIVCLYERVGLVGIDSASELLAVVCNVAEYYRQG